MTPGAKELKSAINVLRRALWVTKLGRQILTSYLCMYLYYALVSLLKACRLPRLQIPHFYTKSNISAKVLEGCRGQSPQPQEKGGKGGTRGESGSPGRHSVNPVQETACLPSSLLGGGGWARRPGLHACDLAAKRCRFFNRNAHPQNRLLRSQLPAGGGGWADGRPGWAGAGPDVAPGLPSAHALHTCSPPRS